MRKSNAMRSAGSAGSAGSAWENKSVRRALNLVVLHTFHPTNFIPLCFFLLIPQTNQYTVNMSVAMCACVCVCVCMQGAVQNFTNNH